MYFPGLLSLLFTIAVVVLPIYLLVRISISSGKTRKQLEATNQKLDRVVAELRSMRLQQQSGRAAPRLEGGDTEIDVPALKPAAFSSESLAELEAPALDPPSAPPDDVEPAASEEPEESDKPAESEAPESFAEGVLCYYCSTALPKSRYLGQPICAACREKALFQDEA